MWRLFYLTKSDRRVVVALLCVAAVAVAVIAVTDGRSDDGRAALQPAAAPAKDGKRQPPTRRRYTYNQGAPRKAELFDFDPNTADSTTLLRLGLRPWQVVNIYKYRAAGGVYRHKRDFARLYGLTLGEYRRLAPHIRISSDYQPAGQQLYRFAPAEERDTLRYPLKLLPEERVALNSADTSLLRRVPGIGSFFARKVVDYRERLGGYCRVEQLMEIEDFPASALAYFTVSGADSCRRMNVNRLSLQALRRHPYINYYQARAIVDYRRLHGPLDSLGQLRLLRDFPPEAIERLKPYVAY